jgi:sugar lactone lactonase YvrE
MLKPIFTFIAALTVSAALAQCGLPLGITPTSGCFLKVNGTGSTVNTIVWKRNDTIVKTANRINGLQGITMYGTSTSGSALNSLYKPQNITFDAAGNAYVADTENYRVLKFAPGASFGTVIAGTGSLGNSATELNRPVSVAVDAAGNVYVADKFNNRIQKFVPGSLVGQTVAGMGGWGNGASQLNNPSTVIVDSAGNLYISDGENKRVQKWAAGATTGVTVAGGTLSTPNQLGYFAGAMAMDANNTMYITDPYANRVVRWVMGANTGTIVASNSALYPTGISVTNSGVMYISTNFNGTNAVVEMWQSGATSGTVVANGGNGVTIYNNNLFVSNDDNIQKYPLIPITGIDTLINLDRIGVYKAVVTTANGCTQTATYNVTNTNKPILTLSSGVNCTNRAITLNSTQNLTQTDWYDNTGTLLQHIVTAAAPNSVYLSNTLGEQYAVVTTVTGCTTKTPNIFVYETPYVGLTGITPTCNAITSITASGTPNAYVFSGGSQGFANEVRNIMVSGIYTVTGTSNFGCTNTASIAITLNTPPNLTFSVPNNRFCIGNSIVINTANNLTDVAQLDWGSGTVQAGDVSVKRSNWGGLTSGGVQRLVIDKSDNLYINTNNGSIVNIGIDGTGSGTVMTTFSNAFSNPPIAASNFSDMHITNKGEVFALNTSQKYIVKNNPVNNSPANYIIPVNPFSTTNPNPLSKPVDITVDSLYNIYICDRTLNAVQKFAPNSTIPTIVAGGNGSGTASNQLNSPSAVIADKFGTIYVADKNNHRIQRFTQNSNAGITVAGGNGNGSAPNQLSFPTQISIDKNGLLYVLDSANHRVQRFTVGNPTGTTVAGGNGAGTNNNQLLKTQGIAVNSKGIVFTIDSVGFRRWKPLADSRLNSFPITNSGTYTVTATSPEGCSKTATYTVPAQIATSVSGTNASNCDYVFNATGGVSYKWSEPGFTNIAQNTATRTGAYAVTITDANTCTTIFTSYIVIDKPTPTIQRDINCKIVASSGNTNSINNIVWQQNGATIKTVKQYETMIYSPNFITNTFPHGKYVVADTTGNVWAFDSIQQKIYSTNTPTGTPIVEFFSPFVCTGLAVDRFNNTYSLYCNPATNATSTLYKKGSTNTTYYLNFANQQYTALGVDNLGNAYAADSYNKNIIKINAANPTGVVVLHWSGATAATTNKVLAIDFDANNNMYLSRQTGIEKYKPSLTNPVTIFTGNYPLMDITADSTLYIANNNYSGSAILKYTAPNYTNPTVVAGSLSQKGYTENLLDYINGFYVAKNGNIYISDKNNQRVRVVNSKFDNTFTPPNTNTYTVIITNDNGCTASATFTPTNLPSNITITPNRTPCLGQNVSLVAAGANVYTWSNNATTANITVTPTIATIYTVTATPTSGTCTLTASISITPQTLPTLSIAQTPIPCAGRATTLQAQGVGSFTWSNNVITPTLNIAANTPTISYTVTVTNSNGCTKTARKIPQYITGADCTGGTGGGGLGTLQNRIADPNTPIISIYPNPTDNKFTLSLNNIDANNPIQSIAVFDINGRILTQYNTQNIDADTNILFDTSEFVTGVYFVKINTNTAIHTEKLVISK